MTEKDNFALVPKTPAALEKAEPGAKRVLSGMVTDALVLVKKQRRSKPRIVLVNDWPEPTKFLKRLICEWFEGVTLLTFQNGADAWQELQREAPDLLITDLWRENDPLDGWAMIPLLAEKKVKYPVLVVSGYPQSAAKLLQQAGQTLDITALAIPFENEELLKVLEACLEKGKMPRKSRPLRIVVVDDEDWLIKMFTVLLRDWFNQNVTLLTFLDSSEAWEELSQADPDLLITRDRMPGLSGEEICQRLLKRSATFPIIVTGGWHPTEQWVREYASRGLNIAFLLSPFTVEQFNQELLSRFGPSNNPSAQFRKSEP